MQMAEPSQRSNSSRRAIIGIARLVLSGGVAFATVVCAGLLYLAFLISIPPCLDPGVAWYNCPPDPAKTAGLALVGIGVLALASLALVRIWTPPRWHSWSWPKRTVVVAGVMVCVLAVAALVVNAMW